MNYRVVSVLLAFALGHVSQALALVSGSIDTLNGTSVVQDVIASDANRDGVPVSVVANVSSNLAPGNDSDVLRVRFSLLDQNDVPHGPEVVVQQTISFPTFPGGLPSWNGSATFSGEIVPNTRLRPGDVFRVKAVLERDAGGGTWTQLDTETQADGGTIWHFTSTDSNDASSNTNVRLTTAALNSPYIIRNVPGQGYFRCVVGGKARRYDHFAATSPDISNITIPLRWTLRDLTDNVDVPLISTTGPVGVDLAEFAAASPNTPVETLFEANVDVVPQNWADIDPLHAYELRIEAGHPGEAVFTLDSTRNTAPANWLALSGVLKFGAFTTTFDALQFNPLPLNPTADPNAHAEGTLTIPAGHGKLPGQPSYAFGGALDVKVLLNGDAQYIGATEVSVSGPASDTVVVNGISYTRGSVTLGTSGAKAASVTMKLPRGMGYSYTAGNRVMKSKVTGANMPLESNLLPSAMVAFFFGGTTYVTLERLPLVFGSSGIAVNVSTGRITFTPSSVAYDAFLELATLETQAVGGLIQWPPGVPLHAGNDQVFRAAKVSGVDVAEISGGSDGAAFVHSLKIGFNAGAWWTHFPQHWVVSMSGPATNNGVFQITNDVVDQDSKLGGVSQVLAFYDRDPKPEDGKPECPSGFPKAGGRFFALSNPTGELRFVADGSLVQSGLKMIDNTAPGSPALNEVTWGTFQTSPALFAHQMDYLPGTGFTGNLMLPGNFLPWRGAEVAGLLLVDRPAALHLSGRGLGSGGLQVEHPHQPAYQAGAADYAGFNLRRDGQTGFVGASRFGGGPTAGYTLMNATKLYLRSGGVSGIVQSADDLGPVPVNGFDMNFDGVKLAFLDNCVAGSKLDGGMLIGGPADITLDFTQLKLWSNGALNRGEVDPNQPPQTLDYWRTTIEPLSMDFVQPDPCAGAASTTYLALGVRSVLPALAGTTPVYGTLGFKSSGALVTRAEQTAEQFALTGLDSRLRPPGSLKLKGPGSSTYGITPVCGIYLNHWSPTGPNPAEGFACIAAAVDVPFFENLTAHLHSSASSVVNANAVVHVMQPPAALGPFTLAEFDLGNLGYPSTDVTLENYRSKADYWPHAKKSWLGMVDFDFPMQWNTSLRRFEMPAAYPPAVPGGPTTPTDVATNLLVTSVRSRVRSLTPSTADIKFKADIGIQPPLPSIDPGVLLGEALEGVTGKFVDSISSQVPGFSEAMQGLAQFEECLADTPEKLVRGPLLKAVEAVRSENPASIDQELFQQKVIEKITPAFNLQAASADLPTSWKQPVMARLDQASSLITTMEGMISPVNNAEKFLDVAQAVFSLAGGSNPPQVPEEVKETLAQARASLASIKSGLTDVRTRVNSIVIAPDWNGVVGLAVPDMPAQPLSLSDAEIVDALMARFLSDSEAAKIGERLREHLSDTRDRLRGTLDTIFGGINEMIQGAIGDIAGDAYAEASGAAGLELGKIDGHALINGDSLHELRLDADLKLALGMDMDFHGWMLFRDLKSDTPQGACRTSAGVAAELTLGAATKFQFGAPPQPTELEIEAKFAFDDAGVPNGLAGRFGVAGDGFKLGVLTIQQAELGFGFGGGDAYLYGKGAGRSDYADIEAAVFIGKACNITDVMGRVDSMVVDLMGYPGVGDFTSNPSATFGFYGFGYGSISVNALIGIPPSCMLNLKAGMGIGAFYFAQENPPGSPQRYHALVGLRNDMGISGEVLCLADISARVSLVGAVPTQGNSILDTLDSPPEKVTGIGKAAFEVSVGVSPFDVTLSKTLRMNFAYPALKYDLDL